VRIQYVFQLFGSSQYRAHFPPPMLTFTAAMRCVLRS
jgi:hypothetical protein